MYKCCSFLFIRSDTSAVVSFCLRVFWKRWVLEFCLAKKRKRTKKCIKISVVFPWKNRSPTYISSRFICLINKLSCGSIPKVKANELPQYRYFHEGTQPHSSCLESLYREGGAVVTKPRHNGPFGLWARVMLNSWSLCAFGIFYK